MPFMSSIRKYMGNKATKLEPVQEEQNITVSVNGENVDISVADKNYSKRAAPDSRPDNTGVDIVDTVTNPIASDSGATYLQYDEEAYQDKYRSQLARSKGMTCESMKPDVLKRLTSRK